MAQKLREEHKGANNPDRPQQYSQSGNCTSKNVRMVKEVVSKLRESKK